VAAVIFVPALETLVPAATIRTLSLYMITQGAAGADVAARTIIAEQA
jgi:hypothetical protein